MCSCALCARVFVTPILVALIAAIMTRYKGIFIGTDLFVDESLYLLVHSPYGAL